MPISRYLPFRAQGYLEPNRVDLIDNDKETLAIGTLYLNDEISSREFTDRAKALKMRRVRSVAAPLITEK